MIWSCHHQVAVIWSCHHQVITRSSPGHHHVAVIWSGHHQVITMSVTTAVDQPIRISSADTPGMASATMVPNSKPSLRTVDQVQGFDQVQVVVVVVYSCSSRTWEKKAIAATWPSNNLSVCSQLGAYTHTHTHTHTQITQGHTHNLFVTRIKGAITGCCPKTIDVLHPADVPKQ
jgi:hypothetical protein